VQGVQVRRRGFIFTGWHPKMAVFKSVRWLEINYNNPEKGELP
jgi:hypothetical protein